MDHIDMRHWLAPELYVIYNCKLLFEFIVYRENQAVHMAFAEVQPYAFIVVVALYALYSRGRSGSRGRGAGLASVVFGLVLAFAASVNLFCTATMTQMWGFIPSFNMLLYAYFLIGGIRMVLLPVRPERGDEREAAQQGPQP